MCSAVCGSDCLNRRFRAAFLWEIEIAEPHCDRRYYSGVEVRLGAREETRSMSEVLLHVAAGNFMLLELVGTARAVIGESAQVVECL